MDADSSYGGSDTAQDCSVQDNNFPGETTSHHDSSDIHQTSQITINSSKPDDNHFYHKNEITLPVNYDETDDSQQNRSSKLPHYLSTANLNVNEGQDHPNNLEGRSNQYSSTNRLNAESPKVRKKSGVDNPGFHDDDVRLPNETNGTAKSTFDDHKSYNNGDLNSSVGLGLSSPTKNDDQMTEAVNLELINLKPTGKDVTGPYEYGANGLDTIPVKKETDVEMGNPYDEYFVPVNEHRKYMRYVSVSICS